MKPKKPCKTVTVTTPTAYVSTALAAKMLNRSISTINIWRWKGKLRPTKDSGGRWLYSIKEIKQLSKEQSH